MPSFTKKVDIRIGITEWVTDVPLTVLVEVTVEKGVLIAGDDFDEAMNLAVYDWCDSNNCEHIEWLYSSLRHNIVLAEDVP